MRETVLGGSRERRLDATATWVADAMRIHQAPVGPATALAALAAAIPAPAAAGARALDARQRHDLRAIAAQTWGFYVADLDARTNLPRDYVSEAPELPSGDYTSGTDIGVYLWSIVAARDLRLISRAEAL